MFLIKNKKYKLAKALIIVLLLLISLSNGVMLAATTTPSTINYQGRLLNSSNIPLTGNYTFRFSIWNSADWQASDTTGAGAIDGTSVRYAGWQEAQSVTTDTYGLFNMNLGSTTPFPSFDANTHKYLQVEVKPAGDPDTSYEILDVQGTLADAIDRKPIENQAYAQNADTIDNKEPGTSAGSIPVLDGSALIPVSEIPGATNANSFILDNDNNAGGPVILQFGATLAKQLSYVPASNWFNFNDNVNIQGNLTTTGTINGVNLSSIPFSNLATRTKGLGFAPDYAGASIDRVGGFNMGTLNLGFEDLGGSTKRSYYNWSTQQVAIQNIDVVLSLQLPMDFVSFTATPINLLYKTNDGVTTTNKVDVTIYDTAGASVSLTGGSNLANTSWTNAAITFGGTPTFTAGQTVTIRIKLSSTNAGFAKISDLIINYNGR